tara:strand:- start:91 stop:315 length:225 start_codon:yes stop_codon:yes gene_type:complete
MGVKNKKKIRLNIILLLNSPNFSAKSIHLLAIKFAIEKDIKEKNTIRISKIKSQFHFDNKKMTKKPIAITRMVS